MEAFNAADRILSGQTRTRAPQQKSKAPPSKPGERPGASSQRGGGALDGFLQRGKEQQSAKEERKDKSSSPEQIQSGAPARSRPQRSRPQRPRQAAAGSDSEAESSEAPSGWDEDSEV